MKKIIAASKYIGLASLLLASYPFVTPEPYNALDFAILTAILFVSFSMFYAAYLLIIKILNT
jgi:hypothetical protein